MAHPFLFLTGYRTVTAERSDAARILNICSARGFVYRRPKFSDTEISIDCSYTTAKRLLEACRAEGIEVRLGSPRGLFGVILRYRHRYGVFIGSVLFFAIIEEYAKYRAAACQKTAIMRAIMEQTGPHTPAGAITFSLPISSVAGLRTVDKD